MKTKKASSLARLQNIASRSLHLSRLASQTSNSNATDGTALKYAWSRVQKSEGKARKEQFSRAQVTAYNQALALTQARKYREVVNLWNQLQPEAVSSGTIALALGAMAEIKEQSAALELVDRLLADLRLHASPDSPKPFDHISFRNFGALAHVIRLLGDQERMNELFELIRKIPGLQYTASMVIELLKLKGGHIGSYKREPTLQTPNNATKADSNIPSDATASPSQISGHESHHLGSTTSKDDKAMSILTLFSNLAAENQDLLKEDNVLSTVCNQLSESGRAVGHFLTFIEEKKIKLGAALLLSLASVYSKESLILPLDFKDRLLAYAANNNVEISGGIVLKLMMGLRHRNYYNEAIELYENYVASESAQGGVSSTETAGEMNSNQLGGYVGSFKLALLTQAMMAYHDIRDFNHIFELYDQSFALVSDAHESTGILVNMAFTDLQKLATSSYSSSKSSSSSSSSSSPVISATASSPSRASITLFAKRTVEVLDQKIRAGNLNSAPASTLASVLSLFIKENHYSAAVNLISTLIAIRNPRPTGRNLKHSVRYLSRALIISSKPPTEEASRLIEKLASLHHPDSGDSESQELLNTISESLSFLAAHVEQKKKTLRQKKELEQSKTSL